MTVNVTKPQVGLTDKLTQVDNNVGGLGGELLKSSTYDEFFTRVPVSGYNIIDNGDFQVSQRGDFESSASTLATGTYYWDRFRCYQANMTGTIQLVDEELPYMGTVKTGVFTATNTISGELLLEQYVDNDDQRVGKTYTFSCWVKANNPNIRLRAFVGTTGSYVLGNTHTGSGGWEFLTLTYTTDTNTSANYRTHQIYNNSQTSGETWSFALMKLEEGPVATPFRSANYGDELLRCQRYYYRVNADAQANNPALGVGYFGSTTTANLIVPFPVKMRKAPTSLEQSGTATDYKVFYSGTVAVCSSVPIFEQASREAGRVTLTISSGGTTGLGAHGISATTGGYLGWSAEG